MKRFTIFITLLVLSVMQMTAQDASTQGTITLSHQGRTTDFAYNKMVDAVETAIDGDTIYLSTGYFEGDFILNKQITFIGVGADTSNSSNPVTYYAAESKIVFKMPENKKLTARLFEGIYFNTTYFTFQTAIENVVFKKCRVYASGISMDADVKSILFDRCDIYGDDYCQSHAIKVIARNCNINDLGIRPYEGNDNNSWRFINCTIWPSHNSRADDNGNYYTWCPIYRGTFINSIIDNGDYDSKYTGLCLYDPQDSETNSSASFTNCLFYKPLEGQDIFKGATVQNDMFFDASSLDDNWNYNIRDFTKEKLLENNFLGTDGTVVGCYGGKNPYTLKQTATTITSSKVHFDRDNKQIQIKMKVSSEQ